MPVFEFDPVKSAANAEKHQIDFIAAQAIWRDERAIELKAGNYGNEERRLVVGKIDDKHWTAVVTLRDGRVRIISVRRAREKERQAHNRRRI